MPRWANVLHPFVAAPVRHARGRSRSTRVEVDAGDHGVDPLAVYGTNCLKFGTEDPAQARGWAGAREGRHAGTGGRRSVASGLFPGAGSSKDQRSLVLTVVSELFTESTKRVAFQSLLQKLR